MKRWKLIPLSISATVFALAIFTTTIGEAAGEVSGKVVYGADNRKDIYEVTDSTLLNLADSTVGLVRNSGLTPKGDAFAIKTTSYASSYGLCKEEPFYDQSTAAFCSGFLVTPDTVVTAGHCIETQASCDTTSFVFNFHVKAAGVYPTEARNDDVYRCKTLVAARVVSTGHDFAVVKLDRAVTNHRPVTLRRSGTPAVGDALTVIGHPAGLPAKISGGAAVRSLQNGYLVANLDTYGGNSGSAVFNDRTGEVEGILVRGETDYKYKNGCMVSNVCTDEGCRGEDVTLIGETLQYIQ